MIKRINRLVTKFKRWMRYNPPGSMTSRGWRLFNKEFEVKAPIRYWFDHNFKKACIYPVKWKYEKITDWVRYRTFNRYHIVDSGLPPGYYGVDRLMLHLNFNILKDFVEVEQSWSTYHWSDEYKESATWCERHLPFYRFFKPYRRPDLGVKHLVWASSLDDPSLPPHEQSVQQAIDARETLKLYQWWVTERPARQEMDVGDYDSQGLGILSSLDDDFNRDAPDYKEYIHKTELRSTQEEEWEREDEEMLIRLIKLRRSLWT